jgi:hypothetical protein
MSSIITLGLGGEGLEPFILTGLYVGFETSVTYEVIIPPDDLSLNVPAEQTEYTTIYTTQYLTDHSGNRLTDHSGNYLAVTTQAVENVYVLHVPPDDLSINVTEEI